MAKVKRTSHTTAKPATSLGERIIAEAAGLPEGVPVGARNLLHLGSRVAVDQSLSRLARRGELIRVGRGLYVRPVETRFGKRAPSVEATLEGIAQARSETIVPHGAAAANALGLTTQVPVKPIFLTSGRPRKLRIGGRTVELRHAAEWQLALGAHHAGEVVRAMAWIGRERAAETLASLRPRLSESLRAELVAARGKMPTWMAEQVSRLVDG